MSTDELQDSTDADEGEDSPEALHLEVQIESPSACQRHITVTVAREDIDRYYDNAFSELMPTAAVPGFRAGRAPRKLIEARYRKEATEQIKGSLLLDSMAQVNEEHSLAAISEPDIDLEAIEVPREGPMTFEFDLEVRPDFDLPQWQGLKIERPESEFGDDEIDEQLKRVLAQYGRQVPTEDPAAAGDYLTVNISSSHEGDSLCKATEHTVCIKQTLSFRDGKIEGFDKLVKGVTAGDTRQAKLELSDSAPNDDLAGKEIDVDIEVLDVKRFELPELTPEFLGELGDFEVEADLRDALKDSLQRQLEYEQQQQARGQITRLLTESAEWDLPAELLKRQSGRELERSVLELRRSGFSETDIQAHTNELRQNSMQATETSLREHFILERIAEEESVDAVEADFDHEIELIAMQSGDTPRKVRAQIEKSDLMDSLRNQIIERKVIDLVLEQAKFEKVKFKPSGGDVEAVDLAVGGGDASEIPVASHGEEEKLAEPKDHT
ncbi:MAG: trigger factor [Planctomycetales bacterium]